MGCCSSRPIEEQDGMTMAVSSTLPEQFTQTTTHTSPHEQPSLDHKPVQPTPITKVNPTQTETPSTKEAFPEKGTEKEFNDTQDSPWTIQVRLSTTAQDIQISIPMKAPYMTVEGLHQQLEPHIQPGYLVKCIYLGKLLPNDMMILPSTENPVAKHVCLLIQRDSVLQAMVYKNTQA
ncbi:hypothetical protein BDF14DRAFT_1880818 [Spinellus fusiger]|nr:hypothetical protein BDF14DRAFT_1880818 [Spinellus fusiger]